MDTPSTPTFTHRGICADGSWRRGGREKGMICHEVWEYQERRAIALLSRLTPICPLCNAVEHLGRTTGTRSLSTRALVKRGFAVGDGAGRCQVLLQKNLTSGNRNFRSTGERTWRFKTSVSLKFKPSGSYSQVVSIFPDEAGRIPTLGQTAVRSASPCRGCALDRSAHARAPAQAPQRPREAPAWSACSRRSTTNHSASGFSGNRRRNDG